MSNPLRAWREKRHLSQIEVAEKLGISRQMVGLLESGARPFTDKMTLLVEEKLGIDRILLRPDLFRKRAA